MKKSFAALVAGFIFALGLEISGMTQPQKVIGFLDIFGSWDPSLIFVMVGAIGLHCITYKLIRLRKAPLLSSDWYVPTKKEITPALIIGSIIFGIGWGLSGVCPGPAITSLASFEFSPLVFVASMLTGMCLFKQADLIFKFKR
ncbi:MAG: YeeE/YedE family protein [Bdellovibrio sp.]|nr:YeeE/YedE family protein [Bdellovibrio sp.]